jgi:hypothetical protein
MQDIFRSQHFTDFTIGKNNRRRKVGNNLNYKTPGQEYKETLHRLVKPTKKVDHWHSSAFDFHYQNEEAVLQAFLGDNSSPDNTASWTIRSAEHPESWIRWKALDVKKNIKPRIDNTELIWKNLWKNANLLLRHSNHKLEKEIILSHPGHPNVFNFQLEIAEDHNFELVNNSFVRIYNEQGILVLETRPVWGKDSSTTALSLDGSQSIKVSLEGGKDNGKNAYIFQLVINQEDLNTVVYPVIIDPTVVVSGTEAIDDTSLMEYAALGWQNYNLGANTVLYFGDNGAGNDRTGLVRCATASIPSGTITGASLALYAKHVGNPGSILAYRMAEANAAWIEGTKTFAAAATGEPTWSNLAHAATPWAGGVGCKSSGVDFDADASPPAIVLTAAYQVLSFTLPPSWFSEWKSGARGNGGLVMRASAAGMNATFNATENATNPATFTLDYTTTTNFIFFKMI